MSELPNILYIHGSGQSVLSWNFYNVFLPNHNQLCVGYDVSENIYDICDRIVQQATHFEGKPFSIVSHSYGCLIAALLLERLDNIENIVALSAPWGGSHTAKWLGRAFRSNTLFKNTTPNSEIITKINTIRSDKKIINVVTTGGANVLAGLGNERDNDGMITVQSQLAVPKMFSNTVYEKFSLSHSEVLLSFDVVSLITKLLFGEHNASNS